MLNRPLLAAVCALSVPMLALAAHAETTFRDIPANHWARRAATVLADRDIMPGRTPTDFAGDAMMTRYELAHVIDRLFTAGGAPSTFIVLSDMPPGHPDTLEVQRVIGFDLLPMRKPGYFQGDQPATRKELVTALDTLFQKSGIAPPARSTSVIFSDVKPNTALGATLDRIVNRYRLFDAKSFSAFFPNSAIPRYSVLAMLMRAIPYLNPSIAAELREAPATPPPASHFPGFSPTPGPVATANTPTAAPTPAPSLAPGASPAPTPEAGTVQVWPAEPILRNRGWAYAEPLLLFSETLPTEVGAVATNEQKAYNGSLVAFGGGASAELWSGQLGGLLQLGSYYEPLTVGTSPIDFIDTFVQAGGLYKVAGGPDWETAIGAGALVRYTYNSSGADLNRFYMTADKMYAGAGPAASFGVRLSPEMTLTGTGLIYPFVNEGYTLNSQSVGLSRWGADLTARIEYALSGGFYATGSLHGFFSGGYTSGFQSYIGSQLGVGTRF